MSVFCKTAWISDDSLEQASKTFDLKSRLYKIFPTYLLFDDLKQVLQVLVLLDYVSVYYALGSIFVARIFWYLSGLTAINYL